MKFTKIHTTHIHTKTTKNRYFQKTPKKSKKPSKPQNPHFPRKPETPSPRNSPKFPNFHTSVHTKFTQKSKNPKILKTMKNHNSKKLKKFERPNFRMASHRHCYKKASDGTHWNYHDFHTPNSGRTETIEIHTPPIRDALKYTVCTLCTPKYTPELHLNK